MRTRFIVLAIILAALPAAGAINHSKRRTAYFEQHEKCVAALKAAKAEAKKHDADERKRMEKSARDAYDRCEEYAHLILKYYPQKPPVPEPKP